MPKDDISARLIRLLKGLSLLNGLTFALTAFSLFGAYSIHQVIDQKSFQDLFTSSQLQLLRDYLTPLSIFSLIYSCLGNLILFILARIHLSQLKKDAQQGYHFYYLGFALSVVNLFYELMATPNVLSVILQLLLAYLYFRGYRDTHFLNDHRQ